MSDEIRILRRGVAEERTPEGWITPRVGALLAVLLDRACTARGVDPPRRILDDANLKAGTRDLDRVAQRLGPAMGAEDL